MRYRTLIGAVVILATGLLAGVAIGWNVRTLPGWATSSERASEALEAHPEDREQEQEHDAHHEHSAEAAGSLSDLEAMTCEHGVRTVDCNNCRFEAGVVKIDPSLESLIETGSVQQIDRTNRLTLNGQIQLDRTRAVEVVSTGSGRVEEVRKLLGEKVGKGDALAVIHSADLGQAKADFLEVQATRELAEATFQREKGLYEKKVSSEADYLDARNAFQAAEASYAAADKRLRLFDLSSEQIAGVRDEQENGAFANLILRAPRDGTIIAQNISLGKIVDTTESLYTIADLSNLWVWCDVYEADLAVLQEQFSQPQPLTARVRVRAFGPEAFEGIVDFVGNVMDEHTRTVKMRVQVKNPAAKLRPGMFADVEVALRQPGRVAAVPRSAVMSDAGRHFVFQQWKNDLWVRRDVALGDRYGSFVELRDGVAMGARIVTGGAFMLKSDVLREKMGAGCAD
jgi:cobalt-zinc-cadmium efflux system membrane fusion protein